jgi:hypothetical protein
MTAAVKNEAAVISRTASATSQPLAMGGFLLSKRKGPESATDSLRGPSTRAASSLALVYLGIHA